MSWCCLSREDFSCCGISTDKVLQLLPPIRRTKIASVLLVGAKEERLNSVRLPMGCFLKCTVHRDGHYGCLKWGLGSRARATVINTRLLWVCMYASSAASIEPPPRRDVSGSIIMYIPPVAPISRTFCRRPVREGRLACQVDLCSKIGQKWRLLLLRCGQTCCGRSRQRNFRAMTTVRNTFGLFVLGRRGGVGMVLTKISPRPICVLPIFRCVCVGGGGPTDVESTSTLVSSQMSTRVAGALQFANLIFRQVRGGTT